MTIVESVEYRKTNHTLPAEAGEAFNRYAETGDRDSRDEYARQLRSAGWTLQSIASASGLTRERVRQIVSESGVGLTDVDGPIPDVPVKPVKTPRVFVEPDPGKLARMLALQPLAQSVRSNSPTYRAEAEEYTRLVAETHLVDGVPLYRLALRLGVSHGALRFRLARYGYKSPQSGASKVYTPVKLANRA